MAEPTQPIRVTVWNEFRHEKSDEAVRRIYPDGIHACIAVGLSKSLGAAAHVGTATLDEPEHGLTAERLAETDVLLWWGHKAHSEVADAVVDRIQQGVLEGMGLIVLHSGHYSRIFKRLMGTGCGLKWREAGELERIWVVNPGHAIADGVPSHFEIAHSEMYGELFDVPPPDELVFISWYEGGEVFRSGCCWTRGKGRVFYFAPGHETYPIYQDANVQRVLANAVRWAAPSLGSPYMFNAANVPNPLSPIRGK